ncbi:MULTISPECIES: ATP-binding protein [unclassified Phenylobacterium]|uniref:ATP-binding protein n=1 Tax=unclassified Phenylobacterium TaxID=2640670 RepID=UPI00083A839F|nr:MULTISPECIES: ATP-binding protein [unclassified Phenylobacterium]
MEADFSYSLPDGGAGLSALLDAFEAALAARDVPPAVASSILIAADEIVSNVVGHGGASAVEVSVRIAGGQVSVSVVDDGPPFDPLAAEAPDTTLSIEAREIGGLGIHLVRKLMDHVDYRRDGKHNRLRFSKSFAPPSRQSADEPS